MRKGILLVLMLLLVGCNEQYLLVKPESVSMEGLQVMPIGQWNQAQNVAIDGLTSWTIDGPSLNELMFFPPIEHGKAIVDEKEYPLFDSSMLPNEVMEFVEISVSKAYKANISERGHLKPVSTKAGQGFQFSFDFVAEDDLTRRVLVTAIQKNEHLYLVMYHAAKLHYFDKDLANVESMMKNVEIL